MAQRNVLGTSQEAARLQTMIRHRTAGEYRGSRLLRCDASGARNPATTADRSPSHDLLDSNLYTVRPDGSGLTQLTRFGRAVEVLSSSYSPDGRWIVVSRTGKDRLPDLFVLRSDGGGIRPLTRTASGTAAPDWGASR